VMGLELGADDYVTKAVSHANCWRASVRCCAATRWRRSCRCATTSAVPYRFAGWELNLRTASRRAGRPQVT